MALAALKGGKTLAEPNQITQGKSQLLERALELFTTPAEREAAGPDVKALHAKIGQLAMENDLLAVISGQHHGRKDRGRNSLSVGSRIERDWITGNH